MGTLGLHDHFFVHKLKIRGNLMGTLGLHDHFFCTQVKNKGKFNEDTRFANLINFGESYLQYLPLSTINLEESYSRTSLTTTRR